MVLRLWRLRTTGLGRLRGGCGFGCFAHFAAEYPNFHADHAVRRLGFGQAVVDVGAERVQRHATFAIPLRPRDLGAVQTTRHAHLDALGTDAHRVRDGTTHGAPELHAALELLRDAFGHQQRVELGFANLGNVQAHVLQRHAEQLRDFTAQLLDVLALLADHDARPRRMNRDIGLLRLALDMDAADRRFLELLAQEFADAVILFHVVREHLRIRIPLRRPLFRDPEANADRMNLLTHRLLVAYPESDVTVALQDSIATTLRSGRIAREKR